MHKQLKFTETEAFLSMVSLRYSSWEEVLGLKILDDFGNGFLHAKLISPDVNLGILRRFVRRRYASEVGDLSGPSLLVQSLRISLLSDLDRYINKNFDEWYSILPIFTSGGMEITGYLPVCYIW